MSHYFYHSVLFVELSGIAFAQGERNSAFEVSLHFEATVWPALDQSDWKNNRNIHGANDGRCDVETNNWELHFHNSKNWRTYLRHIAPVEHVGIEGDIRVLSLAGYLWIEDLGSKSSILNPRPLLFITYAK